MSGKTVTLALDGEPTLDDLATALDGLRELLSGLTIAVAGNHKIDWTVDTLEGGSATATFLGEGPDSALVEGVTAAYLDVGNGILVGALPFDDVPMIGAGARRIKSVLNGRVPSMRFENDEDDVFIPSDAPAIPAVIRESIPGAYGAVLGRVQTLTSRSGLRFTLYDQVHNKAVSCYLQEGQQDLMLDAWDHMALVKGWIKRDPITGRPVTVRRVRSVEIREYEGHVGEWRQARGALRGVGQSEPSEVTIRRLRDAQ